jgi:hypothetical protein
VDASGVAAAQDVQRSRLATHPTVDIYQAGLLVLQVINGSLPEALDPECHPDPSSFLAAVRQFDWSICAELQDLPQDARSFLLACLARDPAARPQTAAAALQFPFLAIKAVSRDGKLILLEGVAEALLVGLACVTAHRKKGVFIIQGPAVATERSTEAAAPNAARSTTVQLDPST